MAKVTFTPDMTGIREILHSDEVQAELEAIAEVMCEQANDAARRHVSVRSWNTVPAYDHHMDQGKYTSIATVHTVSAQGRQDHAIHKTLNSINH
ncbi:MAG: hypothetical protein IJ125_05020 [Atopobiaceae bacterium]|nr:hypothetical protein [Atopobiaceae bacterium]